MRTIPWWRGLLSAAAALGVCGCGSGGMAPVSGTITLDGKPLAGATVTFVPAGGAGQAASGLTDAEGTFQLYTLRPSDGVRYGDYKVLIERPEYPPLELNLGPNPTVEEAMKAWGKGMAERKRNPPPKLAPVPEVYKYADTTPLTQTVPTSGHVRLELSSDVPGSERVAELLAERKRRAEPPKGRPGAKGPGRGEP